MSSKKKILLVEDDINLGTVLEESLEMNGYSVDRTRDGAEGLSRFQSDTFDLCLLDVMLPKIDGFSLLKKIREQNHTVPVIFLTAKSLKEDRIEGFKLGGDDYVTKPFSMEELILRIQAVIKRSSTITIPEPASPVHALGIYRFDPERRELQKGGSITKLTSKESDLLILLCEHRNRLLPRQTALQSVWGEDNFFTGRSMDVYITKLRKHLQDEQAVEIINVHGKGYKLITS